MGVFATRSPYRPNPLGLSCVELESIDFDDPEGPVLYVRGADLMDGTPIYDIKPYIRYADAYPEAKCGYVDGLSERKLHVSISHIKISAFGCDRNGAIGNRGDIIPVAVTEFSVRIFDFPPVSVFGNKGDIAVFFKDRNDFGILGSGISNVEISVSGGDFSRHGICVHRICRRR